MAHLKKRRREHCQTGFKGMAASGGLKGAVRDVNRASLNVIIDAMSLMQLHGSVMECEINGTDCNVQQAVQPKRCRKICIEDCEEFYQ